MTRSLLGGVFLLVFVVPSLAIYCKVGYGQRIKEENREVEFWAKTMWSRNCPDSKFCWEARPLLESGAAMRDLVGGDWNDDYWGDSGGFIYGCQGDFGLTSRPKKGGLVDLERACCNNESGVFVLDQFRGSGKAWKFRVKEVCTENFCSAAFRGRGAGALSLLVATVAMSTVLFAAATSVER